MYDDCTPEVCTRVRRSASALTVPMAILPVIDAPLQVRSGSFLLWEPWLSGWKTGYDVTYGSMLDSLDPASASHKYCSRWTRHEYWSRKMFASDESTG